MVLRPRFASGSAELEAASAAEIATFARSLSLTVRSVSVEGHTDSQALAASSRAKFKDNKGLSQARAAAVEAVFVRSLIDAGRPVPLRGASLGYGETVPVSGATVTLSQGGTTVFTGTTDSTGCTSESVGAGTYDITIDYGADQPYSGTVTVDADSGATVTVSCCTSVCLISCQPELPDGNTEWIPPPGLPMLRGGTNDYHHPERLLDNDRPPDGADDDAAVVPHGAQDVGLLVPQVLAEDVENPADRVVAVAGVQLVKKSPAEPFLPARGPVVPVD